MFEITIDEYEGYDDKAQVFITKPSITLQFEHSLLSLSKWESKWKIPFLTGKEKTPEQLIDYFRCMCLTDVSLDVLNRMDIVDANDLMKYIEDPQTASWIDSRDNPKRNTEIVTSELIYYWMITHTVPFSCETWHLNRLLTLIRICSEKSKPAEKMPASDIAMRNRELNEARRKAMNTNG